MATELERVLCVVQARLGSTRFPGKTLAPFGSSTVLRHQLDRLATVDRLELCVATSDRPEDDAIVAVADELGIGIHRGSAEDVLARFAGALEERGGADRLLVRFCADRPLVCPDLVEELLDAWEPLGRPDYMANNLPPSWPAGLDVELVRGACLLEAAAEAVDPYEREHVTAFVYRRPERYALANLFCPWGNLSRVHLALDTREHYARLQALYARLPEGFDSRDLVTALQLEGVG
jgi:spore coat polysaccharide biosynthesis protein SpsF (cytidylyltransferase family)